MSIQQDVFYCFELWLLSPFYPSPHPHIHLLFVLRTRFEATWKPTRSVAATMPMGVYTPVHVVDCWLLCKLKVYIFTRTKYYRWRMLAPVRGSTVNIRECIRLGFFFCQNHSYFISYNRLFRLLLWYLKKKPILRTSRGSALEVLDVDWWNKFFFSV